MQENFKEIFIGAIRSQNKIRLTFYSKQDKRNLIRVCAPMDFGPRRRPIRPKLIRPKRRSINLTQADHFHVWDYESDGNQHPLSLLPNQIKNIEILDEKFEPSEFVTWSPIKWHIPRNWGNYS